MALKVGRWYKPFEAFTHHYYLILPRERQIVITRAGFGHKDTINLFDAFQDLNYTINVGELQPKNFVPYFITPGQRRFIIRKIFK
jgi:hypothetical protein